MIGKENQYYMTVQELRRILYRNNIHTMIFAARPDEGQEERTYVRVVRCKDYKYWNKNTQECISNYFEDNPEGYCYWGERKEDADIH